MIGIKAFSAVFLLTAFVPNSLPINIDCDYETLDDWKYLDPSYSCTITTLNVKRKSSVTSTSGTHSDGYSDGAVKVIKIFEKACEVIPPGVGSFFPSVEGFSVQKSQLKTITSTDIQQFSNLRELWLDDNNLEYLESNLFEFNPRVEYINCASNNIKYIGGSFFQNLPSLQDTTFSSNPCTNAASLGDLQNQVGQCPLAGAGAFLGDNVKTIGWEDFKVAFDKNYADQSEEAYRQQIFLQNKQIISTHNSLYDQGTSTYSLGVNDFGDWTYSEYLSVMGFFPAEATADDLNEFALHSVRKRSTSPESKDWRQEGAVTPVRNQMKCQSCWAFAAVGALEGLFFRQYRTLYTLSEQQLIDCVKANNGCSKGFTARAFIHTKDIGIVTSDAYPYTGMDQTCSVEPSSLKNNKLRTIDEGDENALKDAVGNIQPVSVGINARLQKFQHHHSGVYFDPDCDNDLDSINHAVLAIGYGFDVEEQIDYWLIKNSHGPTWGEGGFGKMARNKNNHCGIASAANYPEI